MDLNKIILDEYEKLGQGYFGKVFEKGGFAYKVTKSKVEPVIARIIMHLGNELTTFPKIISVTKSKSGLYHIIKRDLIDPLNSTEEDLIDDNRFEIKQYVNNGNIRSYNELKKSELTENLIKFIEDLREDYKKLKISKGLDIHGNNIGINSSGEYILFDF